jgi:RhtB (resistance to homoserine/threonine) family protein
MPTQLWPFIAIGTVFSLSPGPDTVLVVNRALGAGRKDALVTALGSASGLLVWGVASAFGIAAIFAASAVAFTGLKIVGAGYLLYLGIQAILRARRHATQAADSMSEESSHVTDSPRRAFQRGLFTNLLNPKAGAFFVAILPQFISPGEDVLATTLIFAAVDAGLSMSALSLYAFLALATGRILRRASTRRIFDRVTGIILVALGVRLAVESS